MKMLTIDKNKAGRRYALSEERGAFYVAVECSNYNGNVPGGIRREWRFEDIKGRLRLTYDEACVLFARRLAGKAKP